VAGVVDVLTASKSGYDSSMLWVSESYNDDCDDGPPMIRTLSGAHIVALSRLWGSRPQHQQRKSANHAAAKRIAVQQLEATSPRLTGFTPATRQAAGPLQAWQDHQGGEWESFP